MNYDCWIAFAAVVTNYVRWFTFAETEQITDVGGAPKCFCYLFV